MTSDDSDNQRVVENLEECRVLLVKAMEIKNTNHRMIALRHIVEALKELGMAKVRETVVG